MTPSGGSAVNHDFVYDAAGNLVLDDSYFYQYDGFGRLVKVSHRGTLELLGTGGYDDGEPGDWILHHTYDALGRLIRAQRPIPGGTSIYTEHYYYDGVRRIQEVHNNPVFPANDEEGSMEEETSSSTINATWVDREYIHTPGYVDEYVCETDRFDVPMYHIQDSNFNVVGLVDAAGGMLRQYTLDPYGRVIRTEQLDDHAPSRLGHQGLFFDRLDAGITTAGLLPEHMGVTSGGGSNTPIPWLGAHQNRGRSYLAHHRRFAQGDPNGTGLPLLDSMVFGGGIPTPSLATANPKTLFADGANRHAAYGCGPLAVTDPSGLDFSLGSLMMSNAIMGAQWGMGIGAFSGGLHAGLTGGHIGEGILRGAAIGTVAGLAGGTIGGAGMYFAGQGSATGAGLLGAFGLGGMAGGAAGSGYQQLADTGTINPYQMAEDTAWSGLLSMITGGLGGAYNARQARLAADEACVLGFSQRNTVWVFGPNHTPTQWQNRMGRGGWTHQQITEAIGEGAAYPAQNRVTPSNPATRYVHPTTGQSVVIDDVTREVFHIGGPGFKYD